MNAYAHSFVLSLEDGKTETVVLRVHPNTARLRLENRPGVLAVSEAEPLDKAAFEAHLASQPQRSAYHANGHPWKRIQHPRDFKRWLQRVQDGEEAYA